MHHSDLQLNLPELLGHPISNDVFLHYYICLSEGVAKLF